MADSIPALAHAVLMPGFTGPVVPRWLLDAVGHGLGGVCYFAHNVEGPHRLRELSDSIHATGPTLTAIDEEGGTVTRLRSDGASTHVGHAVLGRVDDVGLTRQVARRIAEDVRAAGVDLDLAPVVDVNTNPSNPVIGVRSFGADPALVARHADAFVGALQAAGVAACAKHFPGHGDTDVDSHRGLPVIGTDLEHLRARELVPFAAAIAAGARAIMTAHIVFGALDSRPATVSPAVIGLLRDELGFGGVVVSDAMDMRAVADTIGFGEGVVQALAAGVDLVALGNPENGLEQYESDESAFVAARDAVVVATENGRLPRARLTEAADRVRSLAAWCRRTPVVPADRDAPADCEVPASADDVAAARALRTRGRVSGVLTGPAHVVDARRRHNLASGQRSGVLAEEILARVPGSSVEDAPGAGGDQPVVVITDAPGREADAVLADLLGRYPGAAVVCLGWSGDEDDLPRARNAVFAFGDSLPTARAVVDVLVP